MNAGPRHLFVAARRGTSTGGWWTPVGRLDRTDDGYRFAYLKGAAEHEELLASFRQANMPIAEYYYCAESVLEPSYRGQGIGHAFFDHREARARSLGYQTACFLSVLRRNDHPRTPANYRSHNTFWRKRGYAPVAGFAASFSWKDLDDTDASPKAMTLWQRQLGDGRG